MDTFTMSPFTVVGTFDLTRPTVFSTAFTLVGWRRDVLVQRGRFTVHWTGCWLLVQLPGRLVDLVIPNHLAGIPCRVDFTEDIGDWTIHWLQSWPVMAAKNPSYRFHADLPADLASALDQGKRASSIAA